MTENLAAMIDHTLLKAEATPKEIEQLCREAGENGFFSVCVNPCFVSSAAAQLKNSPVKVCCVIGFPLGATTAAVKSFEAAEAVQNGADELDMVINVGALISGDEDCVLTDISAVVKAAAGKTVKVILETALLTAEQITRGCLLAVQAGAGFVKTSTGFGPGGAEAAHVALMREAVGPLIGVKASGGVRNLKSALEMIRAGASRIGTSSGIMIVKGESSQ